MKIEICHQQGVSMIEMLVTMVILMIGLLGVAGLMAQSQRAEMESYQRVQANVIVRDMVSRMNANRKVASCYVTTGMTPAYLGTGAGTVAASACTTVGTAQERAMAVQDMNAWSNLLAGAGESAGGTNTGAMIGGRGCVSFDAATNTYMVSVAWQGVGLTTTPPASLPCAANLYSNEAQRRVVSLTIEMATLL
ncbi:Type IV fimbrial biogenesis protein PilV [Georgfuchsia toluolica]|uniref:Type IV fimbrial biogenesis protein PilV n=1 Tax=Georgfuchsia toluolica TaxID=424218 RepID=A0A916J1S9_9PROT|nr:type IV pilus modification protein PilV [Georgfuchsia toluolica]CAG4882565.1 Type IV fimbrial biogenesis protein PilV [Georgfuchsia toluolica]